MISLLDIVDGSGRGQMPRTLPADVIRALNKFGASLRVGERIEFQGSRDSGGNVVYLDAERRKRLLTYVKDTYDVRVEGVGTLHGISLSGNIEIDTPYGIITVPVDPEEVTSIYNGNINSLVQFDLTLELDHQDKLRNVRATHEVDLVDEANAAALNELISRINEIAQLNDGWLDGEGEAISSKAAEMAKEFVVRSLSMVALMRAYPSIEGGVTLQLRNERFSASVDFEAGGEIEFVAIGREEDFELDETFEIVDMALISRVAHLFGSERQ
jgi:hypothetical protein